MSHKLELLAPAGSIEVFEAAVSSGADAIYVGAPLANARALAKHFSFEEIAAMTSYAHKNGVKVYIAMNSLVKNDEFKAIIKALSIFDSIGVDAIILQDMGIYSIARKYFPNLRLHASTLLCAHNNISVNKFGEMGFSRVVLARELGIEEINQCSQNSQVEVEVFVHGAMCFSYSGLCLASSFLGGKSGLRGRCVQPCRRKYSWKGKFKGPQSGYFFSMNDLNAIEHIGSLEKAGVKSLKVEGRMRNINYIGNVIKAYRRVIDDGSSPASIAAAKIHLENAMSRKTSSGFFSLPDQKDIITYHHSGNIGRFLGRVVSTKNDRAKVLLNHDVQAGDRIRIHSEKSGESLSLTIKNMWVANQSVTSASEKAEVFIEIPKGVANNDSIYKVDTAQSRLTASKSSKIKPGQFAKQISIFKKKRRISEIVNEIALFSAPSNKNKKHDRKSGSSKFTQRHFEKGNKGRPVNRPNKSIHPSIPLWLKVDSLHKLRKLPDNLHFSKFVIELTPETLSQFKRSGSGIFGINPKAVIWALPPIIHEKYIRFFSSAIQRITQKGFCEWQLSHVHQVDFFDTKKNMKLSGSGFAKGKKRKNKPIKRKKQHKQILHGNYPLNIFNSFALSQMADFGLNTLQVTIEADRNLIMSVSEKSPIDLGVTVFGHPVLLSARAFIEPFKNKAQLMSPKKEPFIIRESSFGMTKVMSENPFSILDKLPELNDIGIGYGVVDLTGTMGSRNQFSDILGQLRTTGRRKKMSSFNYNGTLF